MIKSSTIESSGKAVTTLSNYEGIGFGYLYEGQIYESLGNGYYGLATDSPFPVVAYLIDDGKGYRTAICDDHSLVVEEIKKNGIKI